MKVKQSKTKTSVKKAPEVASQLKKEVKPKQTRVKASATPEGRAKKQYMNNATFFAELIACQKKKKMSNELGKMYTLVAEHYASHPHFSGYTYRDEMVGGAIVACCSAFLKFDPKKSQNPFAFYTMVIHNSFLQTLQKEKKQQRIRDTILADNNMGTSTSYQEYMERLALEGLTAEKEVDAPPKMESNEDPHED